MSRWDILLDRTNQAKIKTDYVNEVNKENEKKYWKERCDKAQDKFFDMIKAEELKEIFDLFEALGGPRFYWEHELGRHPYEVNPQWKAVCPDSRWESGPDYTEDLDMDRIGIGTRHGSGRIAYIPCLRMRFDDPDWGINWNYLSVELYLNKDNHIILHQDGYSYSDRHSVAVFNAMDENKRNAIICEHFVKAYPEFIKNFERIAENVIQQKEMKLENIELPVLHSEKDIPEDVLSTFETYCIKDGISYMMNETCDELYAINSELSDHDINTLLKSAINKHEFDAGDQVYLYADDDKLHHHLEELFDQYLDAPDDFDYVSEEFENGLEQYQDEIGHDEMEL